ncbi:conserved domain protein [Actinomyces sp. oral taxon 170 str. F0386]|nr:conserved domain protein [Actinomyces sp. oral taxon 170 str. F0386]
MSPSPRPGGPSAPRGRALAAPSAQVRHDQDGTGRRRRSTTSTQAPTHTARPGRKEDS